MLPGLAVRLRQEGLVLLKCFMVSQKSSFAELVTDLNGYSAVQGRLVFFYDSDTCRHNQEDYQRKLGDGIFW